MILLSRGLARLATFLLLVALAAVGLATAIGSVSAGTEDVSLPGFARLLSLGELETSAGQLLDKLEAPGPIAVFTALGGAAAIILGIVLLVGLLWPRRERLFVVFRDERGTLATRRRTMRQVTAALAAEAEGTAPRRVRVRPARRGKPGGRVRVRAAADTADADPKQLRAGIEHELEPLTDYGVGAKVKVRKARGNG